MAQTNYGGVNFPPLPKKTIWDKLRADPEQPARPAPPPRAPAPRTIWQNLRDEPADNAPRPTYRPPAGLSPMRQVNAPDSGPPPIIAPPQALDVSRLSPMRQVNAPNIPTTTAAPVVPQLRAPLAVVPPLTQNLAGIWGAVQTGAQVAPPVAQSLVQRFIADQAPERRAPDPLGAPIKRFLGGSEGLAAQAGLAPSPTGTELNPVQPYFAPGTPQDMADYWRRRGALGGILQLADRPRQVMTEPFMAEMWNATVKPEYYQNAQALAAERAELQRQLRATMAAGAQRDDPAVNALEVQIQQIDAQRSANYWDKEVPNQWQAAQQALLSPRGSRAEVQASVERYRREAPAPVQLLQALADPLNVVDFGVAPAYEGYRLASNAARLRQPLTRTIGGVARIATLGDEAEMLAENAARARTGLGRLNPFAPTPYAQAHALTNTANDGLTHIVEASQAAAQQFGGDSWGLFKRFLQDPDAPEVVQATGGWSQTKQAKDAALVNRRALGAWDEQGVAFYAAKTATKEAEAKRLAQAANVQAETTRRIVEAEAKVPEKTRLAYTQEQVARLDDTATSARQAADAATAEVARLEAAGADAVQVSAARQVAEEQVKAADDVARQVAAQKARYATPISKRADAALRKAEDAATSARQAQAAAAGLRRAMPTPGDVDVSSIEKLIERARNPETGQVDDLAAVSELARNYELAATSFFATPVKKLVNGVEREVWDYGATGASTKARWLRDNVNNAISVFYMGYNPGYAFRNAANNLITALADGVTPFQSSDHIRQLWTRWGMPPIETKQGIGVAGDVWKSRAAAVEYTRALGQPARLREVMKGVNWKTPTLTMGQNFERYASERIMAHHVKNYWKQVWPRQVKQITTANLDVMRRAGLSAEQIELRVKLAALAMNADELRDALMYGTMPGTKRIGGSTAAGGLRVPATPPGRGPTGAVVTDLNQVLTPETAQQLEQLGGPELVEQVQQQIVAAPSPAVAVAITEQVAQASDDAMRAAARIDELASAPPAGADPAAVLDYVHEVDRIYDEAMDAHQVRVQAVRDATDGLTPAERQAAWANYRTTERPIFENLGAKVDAFEDTVGRDLGLSDAAIRAGQQYRQDVAAYWQADDSLLDDFFGRRGGTDPAARDAFWQDTLRQRDELRTTMRIKRDAYYTGRADAEYSLRRGGPPAPAAGSAEPPRPSAPPDEAMFIPQQRTPTDTELRTLAKDAGLTGTKGDVAIVNEARKYVDPTIPPEVKSLAKANLTDAQKRQLADVLRERPARKAAEGKPAPRPPKNQNIVPEVRPAAESPTPPEPPAPFVPVAPKPVLQATPVRKIAELPPEALPSGTPAAYGQFTQARTADYTTRYDMHYKVMALDDLITSNLDDLTPNPAYPEALQPRDRSRFGSRDQIDKIIYNFDPDGMLTDSGVLDEGPMIVGADNFVESGNGRTLALRTMLREQPAKWQAYQDKLPAYLERYGIAPQEVAGLTDPVLVRESVNIPDRAVFVQQANADSKLQMAPAEIARADARRMTLESIEQLTIAEDQSIDDALLAAANTDFLRSFLAGIPSNERAALLGAQGRINATGLNRIKSALLSRAYPGDAGAILSEAMLEAVDEGAKNLQTAIFASLPRISRAKSLIDAGQIASDLDITEDIAYVTNVMARLRQSGKSVDEFLAEVAGDNRLFAEGDLTPLQADLLRFFDQYRRSYKPIRNFLNAWADEVTASIGPPASQMGFDMGEPIRPPATTLEDVYGRAKATAIGGPQVAEPAGAPRPVAPAAPEPPRAGLAEPAAAVEPSPVAAEPAAAPVVEAAPVAPPLPPTAPSPRPSVGTISPRVVWDGMEREQRRAVALSIYGNAPASRISGRNWSDLADDAERTSLAQAMREGGFLEAPAPVVPAPPANVEGWSGPVQPVTPTRTVIGKNADGLDIWEDQNHVRHISRNGINLSEPVQMVPTRSGVEIRVVHDDRMHPEFAPVAQTQVSAPMPNAPEALVTPVNVHDRIRTAFRDRSATLMQTFEQAIAADSFPTSGSDLYKLASTVWPEFNPRNESDIDLLYDTVEGLLGKRWAGARSAYGPDASVLDRLELAQEYENALPRRSRSTAITELQQFSTPYPLAEALDSAAGVRPTDVVLEPNGGTGGLVVGLRGQAGKIIVNELDDRRLGVLDAMGVFDEVRKGDALMLGVQGVKADVAVLNPPWGKYTTGRYGKPVAGEFTPGDVAERFFAQTMSTLPNGGRMVALMPTTYFSSASSEFRNWLVKNHTIRAIIQAPPGAYLKRGTDVDSIILVVDKGKWPVANRIIRNVNNGSQPQSLAQLAQAISDIDPRPVGAAVAPQEISQHVRPQPVIRGRGPGEPGAGTGPGPDEAVRTGGRGATGRPGDTGLVSADPSVDGRAADAPGTADVVSGSVRQPEPGTGGGGAERPIGAELAPVRSRADTELRARFERERVEQETAARGSKHFTPYQVRSDQRLSPHPRAVVETQTLAGAPYPALTYDANPAVKATWRAGNISDEQYDVVRATGQAFAAGHGILIADDVGVGKSREIAGSILDLVEGGEAKRILLTTRSDENVTALIDEIKLVAGNRSDRYRFVRVTDYKDAKKQGGALPQFDGPTIYLIDSYNFADYREALKGVRPDTWLADEAHVFRNVAGNTKIGQAWRDMHVDLLRQKARIGYYTATPATVPEDLEYLYALREWTPDDGGFDKFLKRITGNDAGKVDVDAEINAALKPQTGDSEDVLSGGKGGWGKGKADVFSGRVSLPEMEQVMREFKRKGKYISRDLWRGGVEFDVKEIGMNAAKRQEIESAIAVARDIDVKWRQFAKMNSQVNGFGPRGMLQNEIKRRFFDARLDEIMTDADRALARGEQVVIYTVSVNPVEAGRGNMAGAVNSINTWAIKKAKDGSLSDPVEIPEALVAVMELRERMADLPPLRDPIATIQEHFGKENVGMVIGDVSKRQRHAMMNDFQAGKRKVIVISDAGIIGINLHHVLEGTGKRKLLVADYQWAADAFKQLLGRVDRSGQLSSPSMTLYHTGSAAERKFISTIANRLQSLGALSKGQAGGGSAANLDAFEVFGRMGHAAMSQTWEQLSREQRNWFMASNFRNPNAPMLAAEHLGEQAKPLQFFLELQLMPLDVSKKIEDVFVRNYDEISDAMASAEKVKTDRAVGNVLRSTPIAGDLTMHEVKNAAGQRMGILEGVVMLPPPGQPTRIAPIRQALASLNREGEGHRVQYMNFRDEVSGKYISGLVIPSARIENVASALGVSVKRAAHRVESLAEDLLAGDKIDLVGPLSERIALRQRRDGLIAVDGARIGQRSELMAAGAKFSPQGQFFYVDEPDLRRFVEAFPLATDEAPRRPLGADATQRSGPLGNVVNPASQVKVAFANLRDQMTQPARPVPPATAPQIAVLKDLANTQYIPAMVREKAGVASLATKQRNFALGDYTAKRNIHEWLSFLYPYSYWYTFTYKNWAERLAKHPAYLSNYARYKAMLHEENQKRYRAEVGDPNATMPPDWENQIQVTIAGNPLHVNLERTLMPLNALVESFTSKEKEAAPGGKLLKALGDWGPSVWTPYIWAYAAWLNSQGYTEAANELVSYLAPASQPIKSATALYKELGGPGGSAIPGGGFTPEQLFNPQVKGGSIWEKRRIGKYLADMVDSGEVTVEEAQDAAYKQTGPIWEKAMQAETVARAPGNLAAFAFGQGFKARTNAEMLINQAYAEKAKLPKYGEPGYQEAKAKFDALYPWYSLYWASREQDPQSRLASYADMIFKRLPVGKGYYGTLAAAGITEEMYRRFQDNKEQAWSVDDLAQTFAGWQPWEIKQFQAGIEQLGAQLKAPTAAEQATRQQYYTDMDAARAAGAQAAGVTVDEWNRLNTEYGTVKDDPTKKAAWLKAHPNMSAGWAASSKVKDASAAIQQLAPTEPNWYDTGRATAVSKYGEKTVALAESYNDMTKAQRSAWIKANPAKYAQVKAVNSLLFAGKPTTGSGTGYPRSGATGSGTDYWRMYPAGVKVWPGKRSYGGGGGGGGYAPPVPPSAPGAPSAPAWQGLSLITFNSDLANVKAKVPGFDAAVGTLFGSAVLSSLLTYLSLSSAERARWLADPANAAMVAQLNRFMAWFAAQQQAAQAATPPLQPAGMALPPAVNAGAMT